MPAIFVVLKRKPLMDAHEWISIALARSWRSEGNYVVRRKDIWRFAKLSNLCIWTAKKMWAY
jgi:hypothetical protein